MSYILFKQKQRQIYQRLSGFPKGSNLFAQELMGADGRIYLRLADGRGWAFDDSTLFPWLGCGRTFWRGNQVGKTEAWGLNRLLAVILSVSGFPRGVQNLHQWSWYYMQNHLKVLQNKNNARKEYARNWDEWLKPTRCQPLHRSKITSTKAWPLGNARLLATGFRGPITGADQQRRGRFGGR